MPRYRYIAELWVDAPSQDEADETVGGVLEAMLSYDWKRDAWVHGQVKSLEERLYDEAGLALSEMDRQHDNLKPGQIEPDYDRIDRIDAYITGIEKLLAWEG